MGDNYLREVGEVLRIQVRGDTDTCARYGGEEFAVLMPGTNLPQAIIAAERIRAAVEAVGLTNEASSSGKVTISGGLVTMDSPERLSEQEIISQADQALYEAKRRGRNQIVASISSEHITPAPTRTD